MLSIPRLSLADAQALIAGAKKESQRIKVPMCIAVGDESGALIAFERMDGSKAVSVQLSQDKAFAAAVSRRPTHNYNERCAPGNLVNGIQNAFGGRFSIVGGGFPVGAIGGRRDLMSVLDPRAGKLFHSGTFNGNPVTTAAGCVSVRELTAERIAIMDGQAQEFEAAVRKSAERYKLPFSVRRAGSLLNVYFVDTPPKANLTRADGRAAAKFDLAVMNHGLYFASRGMIVLSTVITESDMKEIGQRADAALADVANEL